MLYLFAACILVVGCTPTSTTSVQLIGSGLTHPRSIAVSPEGTVYIADDDGKLFPEKGWLYEVSPTGVTRTIELGGLIPWSIATDAHGNIYATMMPLLDNGIYKIDSLTGPKLLWTARYPKAIAVAANGDVYVIDALSIGDERIVKLAPDGTTTVVASHLQNTVALTVDRFNNLYVSDFSSILMLRPDGQRDTIARSLCTATAFASDSAGDLYVVDGGRWQILSLTIDGIGSKIGSGFKNPVGIAFDAQDNAYVIEGRNSAVKMFPISSVRQTTADLGRSCFANPLDYPDN